MCDGRLILPLTFFCYFTAICDSFWAAGYYHHVRNSLMCPVSRAAAAAHRARSNVSSRHIKSGTQWGRLTKTEERHGRGLSAVCISAFNYETTVEKNTETGLILMLT